MWRKPCTNCLIFMLLYQFLLALNLQVMFKFMNQPIWHILLVVMVRRKVIFDVFKRRKIASGLHIKNEVDRCLMELDEDGKKCGIWYVRLVQFDRSIFHYLPLLQSLLLAPKGLFSIHIKLTHFEDGGSINIFPNLD